MKILRKAVSLVLSAIVVGSLGVTTFADTNTNISIDQTFPDANFRDLLRAYDTDKNGYLYYTELKNITFLSIDDHDGIKDLTGIETLKYTKSLIVTSSDIEETLDLSKCNNLTSVMLAGANNVKSFIGGPGLESLELAHCDKLKNVDISRCVDLESFKLGYCEKVKDTLDLSASKYLNYVDVNFTNITEIKFNSNANITKLQVWNTAIKSINLGNCMDFNTLKTCQVYGNHNLKSIILPKNSFSVLMSHKTSDGYRYDENKKHIYIGNN